MIAIIDYGMGNLRSVQKALEKLGKLSLPKMPTDRQCVVLPGVGYCTRDGKLKSLNLITAIENTTKMINLFSICLACSFFLKKFEAGSQSIRDPRGMSNVLVPQSSAWDEL